MLDSRHFPHFGAAADCSGLGSSRRGAVLGSVPDLYTSGDNDPEIEPQQYYRHFLYCDGCGSFELAPWISPDDHEALEKTRGRLWTAAKIASAFVVAPAWAASGLFPPLTLLVSLAAGFAFALAVLGLVWQRAPLGGSWTFFKAVIPWLLSLAVADVVVDASVPGWLLASLGLVAVAGCLAWRERIGSMIRHRGLRCRGCAATYENGTAFFTDLEANPRRLTPADVPRPHGLLQVRVGRSVPNASAPPSASLPN